MLQSKAANPRRSVIQPNENFIKHPNSMADPSENASQQILKNNSESSTLVNGTHLSMNWTTNVQNYITIPDELMSHSSMSSNSLIEPEETDVVAIECAPPPEKILEATIKQNLYNLSTQKTTIFRNSIQLFQDYIDDHYDSNKTDDDDLEIMDTHQLSSQQDIVDSSEDFACNLCSKQFNSKFNLQLHTYLDHKNKFFVKERVPHFPAYCAACNRFYKTYTDLERHQIFKHHKIDKLRCGVCGIRCVDSSQKSKHAKQEHFDANTEKYKCPSCIKTFFRIEKLEKHQIIHIKLERIHCKVCSELYMNEHKYNLHLKTHDLTQHFYCKFCKISLNSKNEFRKHLILHVTEAMDAFPSYDKDETILADSSVDQIEELSNGIETNFTEPNVQIISPVNQHQEFKSENVIKMEIDFSANTYEPYQPEEQLPVVQFKCELCRLKFQSINYFYYHIKSKHNNVADEQDEFYCFLCKQNYESRDNLYEHFGAIHAYKAKN